MGQAWEEETWSYFKSLAATVPDLLLKIDSHIWGGGEEFEMKKIPFFGQRDSSSNPQGKKTQEIFLRKRMAFNVRQQWIRSGEQSGWRRGGFGFRGGCLRIVSHGMADEIGDFFKFFAADFAA